MTFARTHPWRTFLCAALAINALCFALVRLVPRSQVEFGAALDVAITVPALYLLLIVRAGLQPAVSVAPLFLLGLLRATWLAPGLAFTRPLVATAAEIAICTLLVVRLRRGLRIAREGDVLDRIESAAREIVPSTRAASVLAGELAVFWYAFLRPLCVVAQEPVLRHRLVSRAIETLLSECPLTATIDLMDRRIAARSSAIYLTNGVPEPWSCFDGLDIL